jgi:hypothetical protein
MSKETDDYKRGFYDGFQVGRFGTPQQTTDNYPAQRKVKCSKCSMSWEGAVGFCCPDVHCPIQVKPTSILSSSNKEII